MSSTMTDRPNRPASLRLSPDDPLVVALRDLAPGEPLGFEGVAVQQAIQRGHKVAVTSIPAGAPVRKYGQVIGAASRDIAPGDHIHTHNLAFRPSASPHVIGSQRSNQSVLPENEAATFQGIVRGDGSVATRNYIGITPTVNCSATVARLIADRFRSPDALEAFPTVDGVVALTHAIGCAAGENGEAADMLRRTLGGFARHPNFAAVLLVGLGCESNGLDRLLKDEHLPPGERVHRLVIQEEGGTVATIKRGFDQIKELIADASRVRRETVPAKHLKLALQCGGSDGFSGITANPALGVAADMIVRNGGASILSETPEIYGAEHTLLARAANEDVGKKLLDLITWWERYAEINGETLDNNPSPGNKAGGLTTILEKSLGAAAKGGQSSLVEVVRYAEPVTKHGFVFMDSPGYDPVSATGQVASGANIICFTTGRGSCYGCRPVPSLKLATNTPLYRKMLDDMDINCGTIADGAETVEEVGRHIFERILATASGEKTKSELLGYGADEFAPWHFGATL
jgi:altronate hydrolase